MNGGEKDVTAMSGAPLPLPKLGVGDFGPAQSLIAASRDDFLRLARLLVVGGPAPLGDTEFQVRDTALPICPRLGNRPPPKNSYDGCGVTCPHCGQEAAYHGERLHTFVSLCGPTPLAAGRAAYAPGKVEVTQRLPTCGAE